MKITMRHYKKVFPSFQAALDDLKLVVDAIGIFTCQVCWYQDGAIATFSTENLEVEFSETCWEEF
jgi:hypothetical protein